MTIGDIYAGKSDANDEIREKGYHAFAKNYIEPTDVSIDSLVSTDYGTKIFIMGNKGTGKTALLRFIENCARERDGSACSSFISFEKDITQVKRAKFDQISKSISMSVEIDDQIACDEEDDCDFSYVWKWQFFQKIIADNEIFNGQLFLDDTNWSHFQSEMNKIKRTIINERLIIPSKIGLSSEYNPLSGTIRPEITIEPVDLSKHGYSSTASYARFVRIIDNAEEFLKNVSRSDVPYYILVDELEAYRGAKRQFLRDLRLIRDLLFTVKYLNDVFRDGTKIICSVRPEIIMAINRHIVSRQLNKLTLGFEERLNWEYMTTNSFEHPIMEVLIKRIENSVESRTGQKPAKEQIINDWFATEVYDTNICKYILDRTWYKPRDIVRLLLAAQAKRSRTYTKFNQLAFQTFMPEYSKQCLIEMREEMQALYLDIESDQIFTCLSGFNTEFSYAEIKARAEQMYPQSIFATKTRDVLEDLFRIGVIGNMRPYYPNSRKRVYKWAYKGVDRLTVDDVWKLVVHPALWSALNLSAYIKSLSSSS